MIPLTGHLLVVDDNSLNREMLTRRLERRGFTVSGAEDGSIALEMIEKESFDLVLLDIMMPGVSGIYVLETLRKRFSPAELPIIMATARTQPEDIVEALRLGANDYITKPIDFSVLLARVNTHLNLKQLFKLKDEFLSIASHDLKNPLFVIVCQAYLISNKIPVGTPMTEEALEMVNKIAQHARTMQSIIADFLDFQAVEDGHIKIHHKPVNMNEVAARVTENLQPYAAEKDISLQCMGCEGLPIILGDEARIEQVIQNLVGNALKFNPPQGQVQVNVMCSDAEVRVEVKDRGPGLKDGDMDRVFVKYGRLSNTPTGGEKSSGLGLAICKKLIDLHDGDIGVENNKDGPGACFWFTLTRPEATPEGNESAA